MPNEVFPGNYSNDGLYIADTLQTRVNKNQNQHSFLINKLDSLWQAFNDFSEKITYDDKLEATSLHKLHPDVIYPISFLKSVFDSFELDNTCVCDLESKIESLESFLSNQPTKNNIVDYKENRNKVDQSILEINQCFKNIMKVIQDN